MAEEDSQKRPTATSFGPTSAEVLINGAPDIQIVVDASLSETHTGSNTITDHPVEEGFNVTDHSRPDPDGLTMEAIISNTPLSVQQTTNAVKQGAFTIQSTATVSAPRDTKGRAEEMANKIRALKDQGVLCSVVTSLRVYTSMLVESVSEPRDTKTFDAVRVSIKFKKIRIVKNKLTKKVNAKAKNVGPKVKTGAATPKPVDNRSAAAKLLDKTVAGVGGLGL